MDPGDVPEELKGLSEIEEMLIAQVFTVMTVYRLRGGQNGYKGNVINFPQDVQEFTNRLPRHPSSLDVLVVRRQSANDPTAFRDFNVRRKRVAEDGSVVQLLPHLQDDQIIEENPGDGENDEDTISSTFVPSIPNTRREGIAINETLDRIQNNNHPLIWPEIDGSPINEFQTPGYMAKAFPTLHPYGQADLRSERPRDIKPAEYFKHLMWYKDGRFARHTRWRYFALNSSMRWRGGSRQFWMKRRSELLDMIKQIGHKGLLFFTFSAADFHWHIATWFFHRRFENFFNDVLKPRWDL